MSFRLNEEKRIFEQLKTNYSNRIPVIVVIRKSPSNIRIGKFLVCKFEKTGKIMHELQAMHMCGPNSYLVYGNNIINNHIPIIEIYNKYKSENGFLYLYLMEGSVYG
jgi:endonuclease V-like protein UPF0215 family